MNKKLQEVKNKISSFIDALKRRTIPERFLSKEEKRSSTRVNYSLKNDPVQLPSNVGQIQLFTGQEIIKDLSLEDVLNYKSLDEPRDLQDILDSHYLQYGQDLSKLKGNITDRISQIFINSQRQGLSKSDQAKLISDQTDSFNSQYNKSVAYTSNAAHNDSFVSHVKEFYGDDQLLTMSVQTPCNTCRGLYLKNGKPKIFKASQVIYAGFLIGGGKIPKGKILAPPAHPDCRCIIVKYLGKKLKSPNKIGVSISIAGKTFEI